MIRSIVCFPGSTEPGLGFRVSSLVCGVWCVGVGILMFGVWYLLCGGWNFDAWCLIFGVWCLVFGVR